jgi:hypothetical protein
MSKTRFFEDKENYNILQDISNIQEFPARDLSLSRIQNISFELSADGFKEDENRQLKKKNMYLHQMVTKLKDEKKLSANTAEILRENAELKSQRDQYLHQLKKNEDMLFKARELISHLKADIHLDTLSQNLFNQYNILGLVLIGLGSVMFQL